MSIRLITATAFALTATSTAALAQFTFSGDVTLGYYDDGGSSNDIRLGVIDVEAEYIFSDSAFGVGLDVYGFANLEELDDNLNYFNVYAIYEADFGRFELGHTQSASRLITTDDRVGLGELADFQLGIVFGDIIRRSYVTDQTVYGINYYGDYDAMQVAASVHYIDDADNYVYSVAMRTQFSDNFYLSSGVEVLSETTSSQAPTYRIGGGYEANGLNADFLYTRNILFADGTSLTELDVSYDIARVQGLTAGASYTGLDLFGGGGTNDLYGLGVEYVHDSGFGVGANAAFPDGGSNTYGVEVQYGF